MAKCKFINCENDAMENNLFCSKKCKQNDWWHRKRKKFLVIYCEICTAAYFPDTNKRKICNTPKCIKARDKILQQKLYAKKAKPKGTGVCEECKTPFEKRVGNAIYCDECRKKYNTIKARKERERLKASGTTHSKKYYKSRVTKCNCEKCKEEFQAYGGKFGKIYCKSCSKILREEKENAEKTSNCNTCGNKFRTRKGKGGRDICLPCKNKKQEELLAYTKNDQYEVISRKNTPEENKMIKDYLDRKGK